MYTTEEFSGVCSPHVVRMSFELPYLDWCRFEKSELFRQLTNYLSEIPNEKITQKHTECDALSLQELINLLDEGWKIYDTRATDDEKIKILTLAKMAK